MGFLQRLFHQSSRSLENTVDDNEKKVENFQTEWEPVPAFIPAQETDYQIVSTIATAIAAGDHPNSQFVVQKILQRNPEALTLSLIAASIAAGESSDCHLVIKNIYRKK